MRLAIVIPAHNEAKTIGRIVRSALEQVDPVVVIDDGSTDPTPALASDAGAVVISHTGRLGYGAALRSGFSWAEQQRLDAVICMDADGAHDPVDAARLATLLREENADIILGSRFLDTSVRKNMPSGKVFANRFATSLITALGASTITDAATGYRALRRRVFSHDFASKTFGIAYEMILVASFRGWIIGEAPIAVRYNAEELLVTTAPELLDLLQAVLAHSSTEMLPNLERVVEKARSLEPFSACLVDGDNQIVIIAHPLKDVDGYVFQLQDDFFLHGGDRSSVDITLSGRTGL